MTVLFWSGFWLCKKKNNFRLENGYGSQTVFARLFLFINMKQESDVCCDTVISMSCSLRRFCNYVHVWHVISLQRQVK